MGYNQITTMDISEIKRRAEHGESISSISKSLGYDRKTVRKYLRVIQSNPELKTSSIKKTLNRKLNGRPKEKQNILEAFKEEITGLITGHVVNSDNTNNSTGQNSKQTISSGNLKLKSAFEVICLKHELTGKLSYSSFKRYVRNNNIRNNSPKATCRIQVEPGSQIQIDYCKVGLLTDPAQDRRKTVYAFIGTLSYSRHKYVEFVYSQNKESFIQSHINMFNYFGGVAVTIKLDNLKSGIIKPDLYNPKINRAYAEMAEHYGVFLDPCRVASPKDKGIVERDVQTVREEFKKLVAINPLITIAEANSKIKTWATEIYGTKKHGTTHQEPYLVFKKIEQPILQRLPEEEYQIAQWKVAIVHPDHYIQVNKKAYSMPGDFIGKEVMVKVKHNTVSIYHNEELVKQHTVPLGNRQTDMNDFPEEMHHRLDTGMPFYLRKQAAAISLDFERLIHKILSPNAYINLRRAQGLVSLAKNYPKEIIELASKTALKNHPTVYPKLFKSIIEKHQQRINQTKQEKLNISEETSGFIRDMDYFTH